MGRNCFITNCKGNKNRYLTDRNKKLPAFFRFPKAAELFEEWKKVVPPRTYKRNPKRYPTDKDYLCSLHFKKDDVIQYYEISSIKGCPKSEVVKIERGTWTLKPDAVPCFFSDDNPDAKLMVHESRTKSSKREVPAALDEIGDSCAENLDNVDAETNYVKDKPETPEVMVSETSGVARIDHNYHLPLGKFTRVTATAVKKLIEETTTDSTNYPSYNCESNSDLYTVEQLHEDVLEIALPKNWTFVQNDDDSSTEFISYGMDLSVKSVKFMGSCLPIVTIRNSILEHNRVNSKQDIEQLLISVSIL